MGPFKGINLGGAFNVVLNQSGKHQVVIEAEDDIIEKVRTEVKGSVLHIDMKWDWSWGDNHEVTIYIDFDQLESLEVSGASEVKAETSIRADDLDIRVSGAGDMTLEIDSESLEVVVSGAGDLDISGTTKTQNVRLSGAGDYKAQNLKSRYTQAKASGAGSAVVFASEEIDAYASGAGSVKYYGNPERVISDASGAGSISRR
ncbi:MAG: hypothetical protein DHS20C17_35490 [Cyclobacteriaceae bacterium]|nr:MAG: hypothetical protein DHS20C17_35490 [Cyclobacteriaceae bacterium]